MTLKQLNCASDDRAREALLACCGSETWAEAMLGKRPLADEGALHDAADTVWFSLAPADWLESFSKHPKIGDRSGNAWSAQEQQGMTQASGDAAESMRVLNEQYERKFGWIFIVCATGKSAEEMRGLLEQRLTNDSEAELLIAAVEQAAIMHIRLKKLLAE